MAMISANDEASGCHHDQLAAGLFRALADPSRLAIVCHLRLGEHRVADLVAHLGLAQSTVSQHVAWLRDQGLLTARSQGRATLYALAQPALIAELLAVGDRLLAATGCAPGHCARGQALVS